MSGSDLAEKAEKLKFFAFFAGTARVSLGSREVFRAKGREGREGERLKTRISGHGFHMERASPQARD